MFLSSSTTHNHADELGDLDWLLCSVGFVSCLLRWVVMIYILFRGRFGGNQMENLIAAFVEISVAVSLLSTLSLPI